MDAACYAGSQLRSQGWRGDHRWNYMAGAIEDVRLSSLIDPTPKQRECIEATDQFRFVLYGGAAGGGGLLGAPPNKLPIINPFSCTFWRF